MTSLNKEPCKYLHYYDLRLMDECQFFRTGGISIQGISVRGTRVLVPGYEGFSVRGTRVLVFGVRGNKCSGYEGTRVLVPGYEGYKCSGYEGISVRGTRVLVPGYAGISAGVRRV